MPGQCATNYLYHQSTSLCFHLSVCASVLKSEPRALCMLGKRCPTKLYPQPGAGLTLQHRQGLSYQSSWVQGHSLANLGSSVSELLGNMRMYMTHSILLLLPLDISGSSNSLVLISKEIPIMLFHNSCTDISTNNMQGFAPQSPPPLSLLPFHSISLHCPALTPVPQPSKWKDYRSVPFQIIAIPHCSFNLYLRDDLLCWICLFLYYGCVGCACIRCACTTCQHGVRKGQKKASETQEMACELPCGCWELNSGRAVYALDNQAISLAP